MSYVNLKTKKIVGAQKGSLKYLHEQGHIIYNNSPIGIRNSYRQWFYMFVALSAVILGQFTATFRYASVVFLVLSWYYFGYEEMWCWDYARKHMKGGMTLYVEQKKRTRS